MNKPLPMIFPPVIELIRLEEDDAHGTFGVLKINKSVFCVTLEPQDKLNLADRSSIPAQQYICSKVKSKTFGQTYEVKHVPGRSHILFHAGNVVNHTHGCIILGQYFGKLKGRKAVLNSGKTFETFIRALDGIHFFNLTIKEVY